jgi:hypothetical protein
MTAPTESAFRREVRATLMVAWFEGYFGVQASPTLVRALQLAEEDR